MADYSNTVSALTVSALTVTYGSAAPALQEVSLSAYAGERIGLLGPSGSGKTTFLNICAGLVAATDGSVSLFGRDVGGIRSRTGRSARARVGMVHQQLNLVLPLKVIHNVNAGRLGDWSIMKAIRSLVRPAEFSESVAVLARLGIEDKATSRTSSLSGGQQQRVALARVLRQSPDLILADEPVSAVDPNWSNEVLSLLASEVSERGATLIVSLHDVSLARTYCDRLVGLRHGVVCFDLPAADVTDAMIDDLYAFAAQPSLS